MTQIRIGSTRQSHRNPANHMPITVVPMVLIQRTGLEITTRRLSTPLAYAQLGERLDATTKRVLAQCRFLLGDAVVVDGIHQGEHHTGNNEG